MRSRGCAVPNKSSAPGEQHAQQLIEAPWAHEGASATTSYILEPGTQHLELDFGLT